MTESDVRRKLFQEESSMSTFATQPCTNPVASLRSRKIANVPLPDYVVEQDSGCRPATKIERVTVKSVPILVGLRHVHVRLSPGGVLPSGKYSGEQLRCDL